ncbi:MAG: hypothetical protein ABL949_06955 [Fimbriimonadaceae bacterium]
MDVDLDALAAEELSSSELHQILNRLSAEEFGSENPTVSAVAEATGASVVLVARILTDIRQQSLNEMFGSEISQHRKEIERLTREMQAIKRMTAEAQLANTELESTIRHGTSVESEIRISRRVWFADPVLQATWEERVKTRFREARLAQHQSRRKSK